MMKQLAASILTTALVPVALAIDLQPEDGIAPPGGGQSVQVGHIQSQRSGFYMDGEKVPIDAEVNTAISYARIAQSFDWSGRPSLAYLQVSHGSIRTDNIGANDRSSHMGDLGLVVATWPYVDRAAHRFFGVAGYLILPTGDYDSRYTANFLNTNLGENRYRAALQAAYHQRLAGNLSLQVAFDTTWFGDNNDFGFPTQARLSRRPLYAAQSSLAYRIAPNIGVGATYFFTAGGETSINGSDRNDQVRVQRYQLSSFYQFSTATRVVLQYGGDLKTRFGLKEQDLIILRVTQFF